MAILQILETIGILLLIATLAGTLRRLYFHPLSHIPGPKLAALSWWYEFYFDGIKQGRFVLHIQDLHKQYGPIVRVTPDEIHINDVGFLDTVYAPSTLRRDKYEYQLRTLRVPGGVGTTASYDVHKKRREALTPYFSKKNVISLEPVIAEKVAQLCQLVRHLIAKETPVNLSDAFFALSNDVVTNFLFAHRTDVLADIEKSALLRENSYGLLMGINVNKHFPWLPDFLEALPLSISKPIMPPGLIDMLNLFERVRAELIGIMKSKSSTEKELRKPLDPAGKESVYSSVLDNPILPPAEKTLLRLEQEGALLALAGTESPAKTLSITLYHLAANPSMVRKLRAELSTVPTPLSWSQLEQLPYLSAILEEGNRLSFGVTARTARIAPDQQLTYSPSEYVTTPSPSNPNKSYTIPPNTPISITTLSAHTCSHPAVFPDPYTFDPERWLGEAGRTRRNRFQMAFGKGGRRCLGIELARAELYLVTATLVNEFDFELWETGERDVSFEHDYHVSLPKLDSKGVRVKARKADGV
ncbi:MAG: hypothetical protein Q9160_003294 [Pyrenula sp. 1 TL-2023]